MGHQFDARQEADVIATPEEIWEAIATGPGINSWFMGRNEVEAGKGGAVRAAFGGYTPEHRITAWEPPHRLAYRTDEAPDGRFVGYEFLVEGRGRSSSTVRIVTSGFLPGDDWNDEFEAMTLGGELFFLTLTEYLTHFRNRFATPVTAFGPSVTDWRATWASVRAALGAGEAIHTGDTVRLDPGSGSAVTGTVYAVNAACLGIRTTDAMYRFVQGFRGPLVVMHQLFADVDPGAEERRWQDWLAARTS